MRRLGLCSIRSLWYQVPSFNRCIYMISKRALSRYYIFIPPSATLSVWHRVRVCFASKPSRAGVRKHLLISLEPPLPPSRPHRRRTFYLSTRMGDKANNHRSSAFGSTHRLSNPNIETNTFPNRRAIDVPILRRLLRFLALPLVLDAPLLSLLRTP